VHDDLRGDLYRPGRAGLGRVSGSLRRRATPTDALRDVDAHAPATPGVGATATATRTATPVVGATPPRPHRDVTRPDADADRDSHALDALAFVEGGRRQGGVSGPRARSPGREPDGLRLRRRAERRGARGFARNAATGALTFVEKQVNGGGGVRGSAASSP
jgi:hypothetical protein